MSIELKVSSVNNPPQVAIIYNCSRCEAYVKTELWEVIKLNDMPKVLCLHCFDLLKYHKVI